LGTLPDAILITGLAGWLGTNLLHGLAAQATAAGLRVRCLVLPGEHVSAPPGLRVEEIVGNVADTASLASFAGRVDGGVLFHLAGIIHPPRVRDFYTINHEGTINVINAARAAGIRRAVVISSNSPFGANLSPADVFDERSPYHPYLNYGRSKMLMEEAVLAANEPGRFETVISGAERHRDQRQVANGSPHREKVHAHAGQHRDRRLLERPGEVEQQTRGDQTRGRAPIDVRRAAREAREREDTRRHVRTGEYGPGADESRAEPSCRT
jgi:NAD dependent epimerase/dehydratase family